MKRLREQLDSADPLTARAGAILSDVAPTPESQARFRRIRRRLERPRRRYSLRLLRPVAVFGLVTGVAASAAAAYGVVHVVSSIVGSKQPEPSVAVDTSSGRPDEQRRRPAELAVPPATEPITATESIATAGVEDGGSNEQHAQTTAGDEVTLSSSKPSRQNSRAVTPDHRQGQRAESEARIVQQGLEALRKHNDPKKAAEYLQRYRNEHPDGVLAEEALALAVEAASGRGDPRTQELAVQYLSRYPNGRFRETARRALAKALTKNPPTQKRHFQQPSPHTRERAAP